YAETQLRQGKSLDDLHAELSQQLRDVRKELHRLIDARYEDFLGLSTSLTGIGTTIDSVKPRLSDLYGQISTVHKELAAKLEYVDGRLAHRLAVREKKQMVRVFIDLSQMLDRVSTLLDEASAAGEGGSGSEAEYLKCLERAAADFGQVWYFIEKGGDYPFVEQAGKRMRGLEQRLYTALDDFLAGRIDEFVGSAARGEAGSDAVGLIAQSLCVYGAVDGYERAEEVMRRRMVRPVVGALVASQPGKGMGMDPGAFADMLQRIADFVRRVGAPFAGGIEAHLPSVASTLEARVFWREVAATVLAGLPLLFVPGIPDRFHGNYRAACEFVRTFGGLFSAACKHRDPAVLASEESFVEFNRKWQLSAYFSIRKKQVTDGIEARDGGSEAEIDGVAGASGLCTREAGRAL
ncbi:hypothetical protein GGI02_005798, partial [Coemansia sp. RSA 2322]